MLKTYHMIVHTMNELMIWLNQLRYQTEDGINFLVGMAKNYCWQQCQGPGGEMDGLGCKIGPKCPSRYL
jgi:hypothetical protein